MAGISLDNKAVNALSQLQNTDLDPMEEALFQAWAKANSIKKPDNPEDRVDYRGIYKLSGGDILPHGELQRYATKLNAKDQLQELLSQRLMNHIDSLTQKHLQRIPQPMEPDPNATR